MAVTGVTQVPQIVHYGGAVEKRYQYADGEVYTIGDLVRISSAGTVKLAEAASAGAVHGIALSAGTTDGDTVPVLMFANDTVIRIQTIDGQTPADLSKGSTYTLEVASGTQAVTATTTNGVAKVVDYPITGMPFSDTTGVYDNATDTENGAVLVTILQSVLDGAVA